MFILYIIFTLTAILLGFFLGLFKDVDRSTKKTTASTNKRGKKRSSEKVVPTFSISQKVNAPTAKIGTKSPSSSMTLVYKSEPPSGASLGELIYAKRYSETIRVGKGLLEREPYSASIHVNLMDAYFKKRKDGAKYLNLSTYHAKMALIYGLNTGYASQRLVINLEKTHMIYQAIQLCDVVTDKRYQFSSFGFGDKGEYFDRKERLYKKLHLAKDTESTRLFTDAELSTLYEINSRFGSGHEGYTR